MNWTRCTWVMQSGLESWIGKHTDGQEGRFDQFETSANPFTHYF